MPDKGDKTEKPTHWRLQRAKREGNVPRSREINDGVSIFIMAIILMAVIPYFSKTSIESFRYFFSFSNYRLTPETFIFYMKTIGIIVLKITLPVFLVMIFVGILVTSVQGGFRIKFSRLSLNWGRLNPVAGLKRLLLSRRTLVELLKNILKVVVILWIGYGEMKRAIPLLFTITSLPVVEITRDIGKIALIFTIKVAIFILFFSILDYLYEKYEYIENLKMTKQEVKEEFKNYEGDPRIKSEFRKQQYRFAMRRMMQEVPKADVVITNPEHYSVALKYDSKQMKAPQVVAKGADYLAFKIRKIAKDNNVPIIENPPLARRLYRDVEVGEEIPVELYQAVAEVLAYVYKLKRRAI